jgi:ATP-binding protein involved in chromosome partitioning
MCALMSDAIDPHLTELLANLSAGRASGLRLREGVLSLVLDVGGLDADARAQLGETMTQAARGVPGIQDVRIAMTAEKAAAPRLVAVGSGKGGVGKSTLSANLAVALKALGKRVGMVDADIQGPSLPRLLASEGVKPRAEGNKLIPVPNALGIPMLSMGHLVQPGQAIAWRGPMVGNALGQLIDADWRGIDIIVVDLPPGTGDVQLTMVQRYKPAGAVIVSTPQDLALIDAARAISFFNQAQVPIIGMVENMAGYVCPHCGGVSDPFGTGGAEAEARDLGLAFLGRVPLDIAIRTASDAGTPPAAGADIVGLPFRAIAERVARWLDNQAAGSDGGPGQGSGSPFG